MEEWVVCKGTIQDIIFHNSQNGYTVLTLLTEEGEEIIVVGCLPAAASGEYITASGVWEAHSRYGEQFRAHEIDRQLPKDREEIFRFLASGVCKGIGQKLARKITDHFGTETLDILEYSPEKLAMLRGISLKKAKEISSNFCQTMKLRRMMEFLSHYNLSPILAMRLFEEYGDETLKVIQDNPYIIVEKTGRFSAADTIAMNMGFSEDNPRRIEAALLFELFYNENNGHVFLPRSKLLAAAAKLLSCASPDDALDALIERGEIIQENIANTEACYREELWEIETYVYKKLNMLLLQEVYVDTGTYITEIEEEEEVSYAPQQRKAISTVAQEGIFILTGGPGTGKTTTIRGIVKLFKKLKFNIALAAPTGRAAQRLAELTGYEAQTIHRLLGMRWNEITHQVTFSKSEEDPLDVEAVIIDEMSMVDLPLFSALLRALRLGTRLILVGDADQLPSVGVGNVFSDLIRSGRFQTVFLHEVFRQAEESAIIHNAHVVNLGQTPRLINDQKDFFFLRRYDEQQAAQTIIQLCTVRLPDHMGIPVDEIQILSPVRKGICGVNHLNNLLQSALNPESRFKRELQWGDKLFREGDKIMQTHNNYNIIWQREDGTNGAGIFNGDVGRIVKIDPSGVTVEFDGRIAEYSFHMLNEIDLAYAMTVHKSQGSEYRCVIFAAMPMARNLMVRGVLYTALTRAKELLVIVGNDAVLQTMAENNRRQKRYSGLRWRLSLDTPHG